MVSLFVTRTMLLYLGRYDCWSHELQLFHDPMTAKWYSVVGLFDTDCLKLFEDMLHGGRNRRECTGSSARIAAECQTATDSYKWVTVVAIAGIFSSLINTGHWFYWSQATAHHLFRFVCTDAAWNCVRWSVIWYCFVYSFLIREEWFWQPQYPESLYSHCGLTRISLSQIPGELLVVLSNGLSIELDVGYAKISPTREFPLLSIKRLPYYHGHTIGRSLQTRLYRKSQDKDQR